MFELLSGWRRRKNVIKREKFNKNYLFITLWLCCWWKVQKSLNFINNITQCVLFLRIEWVSSRVNLYDLRVI